MSASGTFEEYVRERFGYARSRAYQLQAAAYCADVVHHGGLVDLTERTLRPLTRLIERKRRDAALFSRHVAPGGPIAAGSGPGDPPARRAGEMLLEAKDQVGHGEWTGWLDRNFHLSSRTASRYMLLVEKQIGRRRPFSTLSEATDAPERPHQETWHAPVREIRVRAARKAGELLKQMAERGERHERGGDQTSDKGSLLPKLSDLGVSAKQSALWQKIATIPEAQLPRAREMKP